MVNVGNIQVLPDGQRFCLDGDDPALVLIIRDRYDLPADLVAWKEGDQGTWWLREGNEVLILGARQLAGAEMTAAPLPIYPTPDAWTSAEGDGVCVLDWDQDLAWLFQGLTLDVGHLDPGVAQALAKRLRENFHTHEPKIVGLEDSEHE
jgi:hypothetical protein